MSTFFRALDKFNTVCKNNGFGNAVRLTLSLLKSAYLKQGIKGIIGKMKSSSELVNIIEEYAYITNRIEIPLMENEKEKILTEPVIVINWIIPDLGVGASGGHTTIFRFIDAFERRGFHNKVYLWGKSVKKTEPEFLKRIVRENFGIDNDKYEIDSDINNISFAHCTIATSWQTAYYLRNFNNTICKFYMVQDYEPFFYAMGSNYLLAEDTYRFGFKGIFAGEWIANKLRRDFKMDGIKFSFAFDNSIYRVEEDNRTGKKNKLLVYARPSTERRCFELALVVVAELVKKMPNLEIGFFGEKVSKYKIPFQHDDYGCLSHKELAKIYNESKACLVMSPTNMSLIPIEALAAGCTVAIGEGDNNWWLIENNKSVIYLSNNPTEMVNDLFNIFTRDISDIDIADEEWLNKHNSWDKECQKVADYLEKEIEDLL